MWSRLSFTILFITLIFPLRPDPLAVEAGDVVPGIYVRILGEDAFFRTEPAADSLSRVRVLHVNFEGEIQVGELVCHSSVAEELVDIFRELFRGSYPIESIIPVDRWNGDDEASMTANNTSAYNFRTIKGTSLLSSHAKGLAVDVNPLYNPCVKHGKVQPEAAAPYADRTKEFEHKITADDPCCKAFRSRGWEWGGNWAGTKDYQHFQKTTR